MNKILYQCIILFLAILIVPLTAFAQSNAESSSGTSSLELGNNGGNLSFNSQEKSIEFEYLKYNFRYDDGESSFSYFGLSMKGAASSSVANILKAGELNPGAEFELKFGSRIVQNESADNIPGFNERIMQLQGQEDSQKKISEYISQKTDEFIKKNESNPLQSPAWSLWFVNSLSFNTSSYNIVDSSIVSGNKLKERTFEGISLQTGFNLWNSNFFNTGIRTMTGISFGAKFDNNISSLSERVFENTSFIGNSTTQSITETKTVYDGDYNTFWSVPVNADIFFAPTWSENIGLYTYWHQKINLEEKNSSNLGIGFFFFKDNDPLQSIGGIVFEVPDIFNNQENDKTIGDKYKINLMVSLNIPIGRNPS